ncbi:uncharacterized protein [Palaemon carinicauda]|uniref:uncharacterized protein n=1 Tax=Palaemon carinicauda TaxID=392227 RepID=UPI0035B58912
MHPRKLLDICIEEFVRLTVCVQETALSDKEKYATVKRMWDELWMLPKNIPTCAADLLHAYLMPSSGKDFSLGFLMALAADLRRITIYPEKYHLSPLRQTLAYSECYAICQEYRLRELDLTGVDMESNTIVLEGLLRKCPCLSILKLGGNVSKTILVLAKEFCPLTVLSITEKEPWGMCQLSLEILMEIFFDVTETGPLEILKRIRKGESPHLQAAWPNLTDLSTGHCHVSNEFFVLAWIVFKKLKYVSSSLRNLDTCLKKYVELRSEIPQLGRLAIVGEYPSTILDIDVVENFLHTVRDIEKFTVYMHTYPDEDLRKVFRRLSESSLCPREISIVNIRLICQDGPKIGTFSLLGKRASKLHLHGAALAAVDVENLGRFLLEFPALSELTFAFRHGLTCTTEKLPKGLCFPQVTLLIIRSFIEQHAFNMLFQMFPNLREIMIFSPDVRFRKLTINFKLLPELRVLKIADWNLVNFSDLLNVPRDTKYNQRFELHGPNDTLSYESMRCIRSSGWNYYPKSKSALEVEYRAKANLR